MITYGEIIKKYGISQHRFYDSIKCNDVGRRREGRAILYDETKIHDLFSNPRKEKESAKRFYDCMEYHKCLGEAAKKDSEMHCQKCVDYRKGKLIDGEI